MYVCVFACVCVCVQDFVIGLSVILRGSVEEKLNWAFNLYDINKDGLITKKVKQLSHPITAIHGQQLRYLKHASSVGNVTYCEVDL